MTKKVFVQPPVNYTGLRVSDPAAVSGGIRAVKSSMHHVFSQVGVMEGIRTMAKLNQFDGFDCPGCAWPDPDGDRAIVEFCENGAKAVAEEATTAKADPQFFKKYSVSALSAWSDYELGKSGRITEPMKLSPGSDHYEPISWQTAFTEIGEHLKTLPSPDQAIFYTSGRTSNEAAFMYQLFVRQFGTNNLPDCSNMCHESSGAALSETVGIGKGSVTLEDFYRTDLIIIIGQNPGTNHPRMLTALEKAKANGAKIIAINPLRETGLLKFKHPQHVGDMLGSGTEITDLYLQIRVNADVALLKALMKLLLEKERDQPGQILDRDFIEQKTTGYSDFLSDLESYSLHELIAQTSIGEDLVRKAADLIASSERIIACWAMGLTQHKNAVDNIREVVNLLLMKGSIGKPGAGTCPVRGHSNVQGDRTVGIWEYLKPSLREKLKENFNFQPPEETGFDTIGSIEAMHQGKVKFFMAMGGNFLSASPDTELTGKALMNCDVTVHVSTKLNRSHLSHGQTSYILPCLGRTEADIQNGRQQFVSVENSTGVVHQSRGNKRPVSNHLKSEPAIVAGLALAALGERSQVDWQAWSADYDLIRNAIEKTIPGFASYNERVRKPGGFYLPNGAREGEFHTRDSKAHFTANQLPAHQMSENEFIMMTIRSHDQFNTTIYGLNDRYRGIHNERRIVLINEQDMLKQGFRSGDKVDIISEYDHIERKAEGFIIIPYDIPATCIATYFPEANSVVPYNHFAHTSRTPISKSVIVRLIPSAA
ncbi:FdhF/YdeP family oxidoreductase [Fulvivirga sedimenti]|uniref:FdhF/YdeP family oxidoreductase n=1 Tax=Fulvivirga sedimenti TaxID=2879465 RepID=A0A9X1L046_9BACT|nr:FdhF/YdeP family oxidoreductase [Fulvivirga sedimenti]MCA6075249.1 FdhF/YdeP family oxidoreductase [Fulvivirga sedimenti]MCA6076426.1 FdhF/YdeP family oxidoreductase [Fulvivirga sedimenti]MCA6077554.1 FdhF/YdeP family oxidoreductase [Fulvivirga sedimenti]